MPTDDETKAKIVCNAELAEELRAVATLLESLGQLMGERIDAVLAAIRLAALRLESIPAAAGREEVPE